MSMGAAMPPQSRDEKAAMSRATAPGPNRPSGSAHQPARLPATRHGE
jgi:hypothetical protein